MVRINFIHASFGGSNVDVCLDGNLVLSNVAYADFANFACFAGQSFCKLEIKQTGTTTVLACLSCFTFPCEGTYSLILHWNIDETAMVITCYDNCDVKGNFLFRHAAGVGPVNVCKTDASPPIQVYTSVAQGGNVSGTFFPNGTNEITVKLAADSSELLVVSDLEISENTLTILYFTGGINNGYSTVRETIALLPKCVTYWCDVYRNPCC